MDFIDGVTLIEEIRVHTLMTLLIGLAVEIVGIIIGIAAIRIYINETLYESNKLKHLANLALMIVAGIIILEGAIFSLDTTSFETVKDKFDLMKSTSQYRVSVTDNVDMNEFYEKYEIISYKNGIYVVKKKGEQI